MSQGGIVWYTELKNARGSGPNLLKMNLRLMFFSDRTLGYMCHWYFTSQPFVQACPGYFADTYGGHEKRMTREIPVVLLRPMPETSRR